MRYIKPGATEYFYFPAYDSNDPSDSTTISGFALADIKIFKDGGTTERASTSGFTLLDTDGIDFSAETGVNGFSIDFSDNTTAGFWEAGHHYIPVVGPITVDAATNVRWVGDAFRIGYEGAILNTSIATYTSQTSFTLSEGSADDDAYNNCICWIHDVASDIQVQHAPVLDYVGSTKTITLDVDPGVFTMTAADNISIFPPTGLSAINGSKISGTGVGDKFTS